MLSGFSKISRSIPPRSLAWLANRIPASIFQQSIYENFRSTLFYVSRHSPFYRRAFADRRIDPRKIRSPDDLGDFFTTADDILRFEKDFICEPPGIVFESSGTSGKNKHIYFSHNEMRVMAHNSAAGLHLYGINKNDRVANAFDFSLWISGLLSHYGLVQAGIFTAPFGKVEPIEVYDRIRDYNFNIIMGLPSWLTKLTQVAQDRGPFKLKMLLGGGEGLNPEVRKWMSQVWGSARVSINYASAEMGGVLGFQPCANTDFYHLNILDFWPEIIDPDANGFGEIVFTTLNRTTMPLIRFRTSDIARFENSKCPCGLKFPLMSTIKGRKDEIVVAGGFNVFPVMIENVIAAIPGIYKDFQAVLKSEKIHDIFELNLETSRQDISTIESEFRSQVQKQYPELMRNIDVGMLNLRLVLHPPGTLRTGRKLRKILDLRTK
jgi:phenylacetate-CoA ligase